MHTKKKHTKRKKNNKKIFKSLFFYSGRLFVVLVTIDTGPLLLYVCWKNSSFPCLYAPLYSFDPLPMPSDQSEMLTDSVAQTTSLQQNLHLQAGEGTRNVYRKCWLVYLCVCMVFLNFDNLWYGPEILPLDCGCDFSAAEKDEISDSGSLGLAGSPKDSGLCDLSSNLPKQENRKKRKKNPSFSSIENRCYFTFSTSSKQSPLHLSPSHDPWSETGEFEAQSRVYI